MGHGRRILCYSILSRSDICIVTDGGSCKALNNLVSPKCCNSAAEIKMCEHLVRAEENEGWGIQECPILTTTREYIRRLVRLVRMDK